MCTLVFGLDVLGPHSLVIGANRDEDPARPTEAPRALSIVPHVVGGRDLESHGTWLAIRDARAAVALLNRRPPERRPSAAATPTRSRGRLALDVALAEPTASPDRLAAAARAEALSSVADHPYAPFTLVCLTPGAGWAMSLGDDGAPAFVEASPGWHVITHADLDDRGEPRTRRLLGLLEGFRPHSALEAEARLLDLLSLHAEPDGTEGEGREAPAVCIHSGRMVTVSTSLFVVQGERARYLHLEGRPCTTAPQDLSPLLVPSRAREVL